MPTTVWMPAHRNPINPVIGEILYSEADLPRGWDTMYRRTPTSLSEGWFKVILNTCGGDAGEYADSFKALSNGSSFHPFYGSDKTYTGNV